MTDPTELAPLRGQIDALDDQLAGLIAQRLDIARRLGVLKQTAQRDPEREAHVLARLTQLRVLPPEVISLIWNAFFQASAQVQRPPRDG